MPPLTTAERCATLCGAYFGRSKAHKHENHETAIYIISGETNAWYIPPGVPHLAANLSDGPYVQVIARTDPNEVENVVLLPELEALVPT